MAAERVEADVRRIVREVYPLQPVQRFATVEDIVNDSIADRRAYGKIASAFAIGMLLLAGIGLCGHLTHLVTERSIRSALGASLSNQRWLLVAHLIPSLVVGLVLSIVAAYLLFSLINPFLYEVPRLEPVSCLVSAIFVLGFTASAIIVPAARMTRLSPALMLSR